MGELSFCLLTTFYPPAGFGGDAVHVQRLAGGLARRGHRVRVVHNPTAFRMLAKGQTGVAPAPTEGVEVVPAPVGALGTLGTHLSGRPTGYRQLLARLVSDFDVVHLHNPSLLGGQAALGLGDGLRLYTTHEHWLLCPTHVLYRYGREVCTKRTCVTCTLSYHRPPQLWRAGGALERSVAQLHAVLSPSRFTAALHREHFPGAPVEVVPLFVPDVGAQPPAASSAPRTPFFLYAGRLEPIKGIERLVAAFPRVRGAELVVAGAGSQEALLRRIAAGCPRVRFAGQLGHEALSTLMSTALAVVVPSAGYETFGGSAVEAMARGTPALVRALGPLPELVEEGGGRVFDDDDALVSTMQRLVDAPEEAVRLGAEARRVAGERYSESRFFETYFGVVGRAARDAGLGDLARRVDAACSSP